MTNVCNYSTLPTEMRGAGEPFFLVTIIKLICSILQCSGIFLLIQMTTDLSGDELLGLFLPVMPIKSDLQFILSL